MGILQGCSILCMPNYLIYGGKVLVGANSMIWIGNLAAAHRLRWDIESNEKHQGK